MSKNIIFAIAAAAVLALTAGFVSAADAGAVGLAMAVGAPMAGLRRRREILMGGPVQGTHASGTAATVTITASEPGVLRLSDAMLTVTAADVDLGGTDLIRGDLTPICRIQALTINGSTLLVRGRNTPSGPAAILGVGRQSNFVGLPDLRVETGDTVALTILMTRTNMGTAPICFAAPFLPDRFRALIDDYSIFGRGEFLVSSPVAALDGAGDNATLTVTFDSPGFIDLSRGVLHGSATLGVNVAADGYDTQTHDDLPILVLQAILRSDYNIVVGQGTPSCPNVWNVHRRRNFAALGVHEVSAGDQLVITAEVQGTGTTLDGSAYFTVPQVLRRNSPGCK
jgi:hypothetical protein